MTAGGAVSVREGGAGDAGLAYGLIQSAFGAVTAPIDPPLGALREQAETLAAKIAAGETLLIAEIAGDPVGCLFCDVQGSALYAGRLAVRADAQGRGVARALLAAAENRAREAGVAKLQLKARVAMPQNVALFARLGFAVVGEGRHDGYDVATYKVMERPLGR